MWAITFRSFIYTVQVKAKVKVKFALEQDTKGQRGAEVPTNDPVFHRHGCIHLRLRDFFNLGPRWSGC